MKKYLVLCNIGATLFCTLSFAETCNNMYFNNFGGMAEQPYIQYRMLEERWFANEIISDNFDKESILEHINVFLKDGGNDHIEFLGRDINLLDAALFFSLKSDVTNKLYAMGYRVSDPAIDLLLNKYGGEKLLSDLIEFHDGDLNSISLNYKKGKYSLSNYFLLQRDFKSLSKLRALRTFDVESNFYSGVKIDIRNFTLLERNKAAEFINIRTYEKDFITQDKLERETAKKESLIFNNYRHYDLYNHCSPNDVDIVKSKIKYALGYHELSDMLLQEGKSIENLNESDIMIFKEQPIAQDYIKYLLSLSERKLTSSQIISDFNSATSQEINKYINDTNKTYYSYEGVSINEFLFINRNGEWGDNIDKFNITRVADYLRKNPNKIKKMSNSNITLISNSYYMGKNFSHYILRDIKNIDKIKKILKSFGVPKNQFGLNISEWYWIKSLHNPSFEKAYNYSLDAFSNKNRLIK